MNYHRKSELPEPHVEEILAATLRSESGRILGVLTRVSGSLEDAEDILQSAGAVALQRWPASGLPTRLGAWLTTVAKRKALDLLLRRREQKLNRRLEEGRTASEDQDPYSLLEAWPDERLRLLFFCCHPALQKRDRLAMNYQDLRYPRPQEQKTLVEEVQRHGTVYRSGCP